MLCCTGKISAPTSTILFSYENFKAQGCLSTTPQIHTHGHTLEPDVAKCKPDQGCISQRDQRNCSAALHSIRDVWSHHMNTAYLSKSIAHPVPENWHRTCSLIENINDVGPCQDTVKRRSRFNMDTMAQALIAPYCTLGVYSPCRRVICND